MNSKKSKNSHYELQPIIKWAGGKERELKYILPNAPTDVKNYYEPFVGGGSVFVSMEAEKYFINDKSNELINLYSYIAGSDKGFFDWLALIAVSWKTMKNFVDIKSDIVSKYNIFRENVISVKEMDSYILVLIEKYNKKFSNVLSEKFLWKRQKLLYELQKNLISKIHRMYKIELEKGRLSNEDLYENIETAFMSALYMYYRALYNDEEIMKNKRLATALFVFIRNYAYSGMFRYNDDGKFNVPYGGIGYNSKTLDKKINYYKSKEIIKLFDKTSIFCLDFEAFLEKNSPKENDFVFLDIYTTRLIQWDKRECLKKSA